MRRAVTFVLDEAAVLVHAGTKPRAYTFVRVIGVGGGEVRQPYVVTVDYYGRHMRYARGSRGTVMRRDWMVVDPLKPDSRLYPASELPALRAAGEVAP